MDDSAAAALIRAHAADDCCMITTTGRSSGRPHRIEIWFGVLEDAMYLISGNGPTADWYRNALEHPVVTVELGGRVIACTAAPVSDPRERRRVGEVMGAKYPWDGDPSIGLTRDAWCFDVPVLRLTASAAG